MDLHKDRIGQDFSAYTAPYILLEVHRVRIGSLFLKLGKAK